MPLLEFTERGIFCPEAGVYVDPSRSVSRAVITHAHSDHIRPGCGSYLCQRMSAPLLRLRLGADCSIQEVDYGEKMMCNGVQISLHPAGHIPGSSQVRFQRGGETWVVSGDYKLEDDGLSKPFEPLRCQVFITESTFALPIFRWSSQDEVFGQIREWWQENQSYGRVSVLLCYSLGKAQRLLSRLAIDAPGPVYCHGSILAVNHVLTQAGLRLPSARKLTDSLSREEMSGALVLSPPAVVGSRWLEQVAPYTLAWASGWMAVGRMRRRRRTERGFIISDHADFQGIETAVRESRAARVLVTHGYSRQFARYLCEKGIEAEVVDPEKEAADE